MSFKIASRRKEDLGAASVSEHAGHGGMLATVLSGVALVMSGLSYYETSYKTADLSVYVPPMIHYARDGDADVFNMPITIANDGAKNGTVLTMDLEVQKLEPGGRRSRHFHSIFLGDWPRDDKVPNRSFAPLSIPGHGTFTETVRFYPMDEGGGFIVTDKGNFRFTLKLVVAQPPEASWLDKLAAAPPKPIVFELGIDQLSIQHLTFRNGTQAMYSKTWKSATSFDTPAADSEPSAAPTDSESERPQAQPQSAPDPAPKPENLSDPAPQPPARKIEIITEPPAAPPPVQAKTAPGAAAAKTAQPAKR